MNHKPPDILENARQNEQGAGARHSPAAAPRSSMVQPPPAVPAMPRAPRGAQGQAGTGTRKHAAGNTPARGQVSVEAASKFQTVTKSNPKTVGAVNVTLTGVRS